jgi:hypothetical protein
MPMTLKLLTPTLLLALFFLPLGGCGCGFDCNDNDNNNNPASLTLGFSDSLPEALEKVFIEVDSITFRRSGAEDVIVDTFTVTIGSETFTDVDTFQMNLLDYQGFKQLVVIKDLSLDTGTYSEVVIGIVDDIIDNSYVDDSDGERQTLTIAGGSLTLKDLRLSSGTEIYSVEFGLAQALHESSPDNYELSTTGMRLENNQLDATLSGQVDPTLFNTAIACSEKPEPLVGNRVYLYQGRDLLLERLADVYTSGSSEPPPEDALAPFAVASLQQVEFTGNWEYSFGYLPAGDYTLAFSCNTEGDDSIEYDGLVIPLPEGQVYNLTLAEKDKAQCNLEEGASC